MGSVISDIDCPNCKHEAYVDLNYKTAEEYAYCGNCGYYYSKLWKRGDDGKFVTKDGSNSYKFDNLIIVVDELKTPFGSYRIKTYGSDVVQCGSLENEDDYEDFKNKVKSDNNIEFSSVSRFINGEINVEEIFAN